MPVIKEGSVRVDLVGGTLDLEPIHLILKNVVTINVATSLKAKVKLERNKENYIEIISEDYGTSQKFDKSEFNSENLYHSQHFGPMTFVCQILDYFNVTSGITITLSSGAPTGSGLGGSSAMGVTLVSALCELTEQKKSKLEMITKVKAIESRILNQGIAGYQDYYPALFGGILGLKAAVGEVVVDQLYSEDLKRFLEEHVTLVYSGQSRHSGINNWEVYKAFFDGKKETRQGMKEIADISYATYEAIKKKNYNDIIELIGKEGETRKKLFPGIESKEIQSFFSSLKKHHPKVGIKMCGAGGGGCFILVHPSTDAKDIQAAVVKAGMKVLAFKVDKPLT
ncbi:MAG: hypothetical protein JNM93_02340 [Bacteriovoracaceae bacterium]|nr:hypothetical protein [Bacteriovoracaceae bacterium]